MAIELTVVDENGNPFTAGTALVLLGDGQPLGCRAGCYRCSLFRGRYGRARNG